MDIVERLAQWAENDMKAEAVALEAKNEIERLREVLKRIGDGDQCTVLLVHPTRCKRAYEARAALKETE
jgi:ABC-type hemin transport system substrate-binding protein